MSAEQFQTLLKTITETRIDTTQTQVSTGSFSNCTASFDGKRCFTTVEAFITTVSIYKDIEKITDADALQGLPLLLPHNASIWWQGVKNSGNTWRAAIDLIRAAFSPSKPAHQIYIDIFAERQNKHDSIDEFICKKRALLAQLPNNRHDERTQLDMIFGLLHINIRKEISRESIQTFSDLLQKGRDVELVQQETGLFEKPKQIEQNNSKPSTGKSKGSRCNYCQYRGHTMDVCRKKLMKEKENATKQENHNPKAEHTPQNIIVCYGCGKTGFFRSNCPNCSQKKANFDAQAVHFFLISNVAEYNDSSTNYSYHSKWYFRNRSHRHGCKNQRRQQKPLRMPQTNTIRYL